MYCGCNEKALGSQHAIACALLRLLEGERYDAVSISALCREAGVSRPTFYALFGSKDDVVVYLLRESFHFELEPTGGSALESLCRGYSRYFDRNRAFLALLVKNDLGNLLYRSILASLLDCPCFHTELEEPPRRFAAAFTAGALTGVVQNYVNQEPQVYEDLDLILLELFSGEAFAK